MDAAQLMLRSSPTLAGRCWCRGFRLRTRRGSCCDPHRPWRAGAGLAIGETTNRILQVAILTDPGGPVLERVLGVRGVPRVHVAILTDPGGPVLGAAEALPVPVWVRCCDPHRPWRAGAGSHLADTVLYWKPLRSSPTLAGRCWCPDVVMLVLADHLVAILTDPGGPVLVAPLTLADTARLADVAILTDPGGPVLGHPFPFQQQPDQGSCDPHRPWRAGAGRWILGEYSANPLLRSSPTLAGRCWMDR